MKKYTQKNNTHVQHAKYRKNQTHKMQDRVHNKHVQENTLKSYTQYVYSDVTHKVHRMLVFLRKSEDDGQLLAMPFGW